MSDSNGTTLTVYQRMPDQLEAVKVLGGAIAKSGMFGCSNVEAGMVFAAECMFRNMPPLALAERYHVIFGKLSMKAEAMLAGFEDLGGTYEVLSRTPDLVSIEMTPKGKRKHILSLSWDDAQKEPFAYEGKEEAIVDKLTKGEKPKLKTKYATPRSRMQMLWARLISDSVRFLCPSVVSGKYTPEEIEDFDESEVAAGRSKRNGSGQVKSATVVENAAVATTNPLSNAVDVEIEKKTEVTATATAVPADPLIEFTTPDQRAKIEELFATLSLTADQQIKSFEKRNASGFRNLTTALADDLISALCKRLEQVKAKANAALPEIKPGTEQLPATCGPCTPDQDKAIRAKFQEWKQTDPAAATEGFRQLTKKLHDSGRQKLLELSANDAAKLYDCIQVHNMASFLSRSLEEWKRPEAVAAEVSATPVTAS